MDDYERFVIDFRAATNIDLSLYKRMQMERRLRALRDRYGYDTFSAYWTDVLQNPEHMNELVDRVTINVSEFYRNSDRWTYLQDVAAPELWRRQKRSPRPQPMRCWSAACSTGEEPYTLALVLQKSVPLEDIEILATDIDVRALSVAREGRYALDTVRAVPSEIRRRFFALDPSDGTEKISAAIADRVEFRRHDLLRDPYGGDYDLIVCRNVLIYFTEDAKDDVFARFAKALNPGGVLFVGSTEHIPDSERFGLVARAPYFYQRPE